MKLAFGILGLLLTLVIVGLLAKRQLGEVSKPLSALQTLPGAPASAPADASPRQQTEQVRQAVQGLMQQPRTEAEAQSPSK